MASMGPAQYIYPLENYSFGQKEALKDLDFSTKVRLARHQKKYEIEGMRRTVEGVLLVQDHRMPYVLLLQHRKTQTYRLPGGHLRPGESDVEGLKRKLCKYMAPVPKPGVTDTLFETVGELLATLWRLDFDDVANQSDEHEHEYPYLPSHCTKPKECRKIFMIPLPEKAKFALPKGFTPLAVPLFELFDNKSFSPLIASIPHLVSRFSFTLIDSSKSIEASTKGDAEEGKATSAAMPTDAAAATVEDDGTVNVTPVEGSTADVSEPAEKKAKVQ